MNTHYDLIGQLIDQDTGAYCFIVAPYSDTPLEKASFLIARTEKMRIINNRGNGQSFLIIGKFTTIAMNSNPYDTSTWFSIDHHLGYTSSRHYNVRAQQIIMRS